MSSPAEIIAAVLRSAGHGTLPQDGQPWPLFTRTLPDQPDAAIVVHDTTPVLDGRYHLTGRTVSHPGVQVMLREPESGLDGWDRIDAIAHTLDTLPRQSVAMDDADYLVHSIRRSSGPVDIGQDGEQRRFLYSLNVVATISVVA